MLPGHEVQIMITGRKLGGYLSLVCGCGHEPIRVTYLGVDPTFPHLRLDCEACGRHSVVKIRNARSFPHAPLAPEPSREAQALKR